jgi:hypothetical protein
MSEKWAVMQSLSTEPLGTVGAEAALQSPFNQKPTSVIVKVKNWSAQIPRKVLKTPISFKRGAERLTEKQKGGMTTEAIQIASFTQDMSIYEDSIKPVKAVLTWNGQAYMIPPSASKEEEPVAVTVPDGVWDLYLGNYDRMRDPDPNVRVQEATLLALRRGGRTSPVIERDPHTGEISSGFLEFIREEVRPQAVAVDKAALSAGDIEEV